MNWSAIWETYATKLTSVCINRKLYEVSTAKSTVKRFMTEKNIIYHELSPIKLFPLTGISHRKGLNTFE